MLNNQYDLTKKIAIVINARAESKRIPNKMTKDFAGSSLFEVAVRKLLTSKIINKNDIYFAYNANGNEFDHIIDKVSIDRYIYPLQKILRTKESTEEEKDQKKIYEFYQKLIHQYDYCVLVNPCCPLLKIETIDAFYQTFKYSDKDGLFGVLKKKNYFWDRDKIPINLPGHGGIMNTKDPLCQVYEAAHCLYGSKLSFIPEKRWMGGFSKEGPELFIVPENEAFDIDYPWQFEYGEILYKGINNG